MGSIKTWKFTFDYELEIGYVFKGEFKYDIEGKTLETLKKVVSNSNITTYDTAYINMEGTVYGNSSSAQLYGAPENCYPEEYDNEIIIEKMIFTLYNNGKRVYSCDVPEELYSEIYEKNKKSIEKCAMKKD